MGPCEDGTDLLLLPSYNADPRTLAAIPGVESWPERQLIELRHLRHPDNRVVMLTPEPVNEACLDAVLELIPAAPAAWLRRRLQLIPLHDRSPGSLTGKLLQRPRLLQQLQDLLRPGALLAAYAVGEGERQVAERLGLRLEGSVADLADLGSKAGSAALFRELGLPQPRGTGLCFDLETLAEAIEALLLRHPDLEAVVVKLNRMAGGHGNAPLPLEPVPWRQLAGTARLQRLRRALEVLPMPLPHWREEMRNHGVLAQELIRPGPGAGRRLSSPSVQLWIDPEGRAELISTHEQRLGGPHGQSFTGCRFPARAAYRPALMAIGRRLGAHLAARGCRGPVLLDLLARRDPQGWRLWAIEINLRKGGTSHPFQLASCLVGCGIDPDSGELPALDGSTLCYEASDAIGAQHWRGLLPEQLLEAMLRHDLYLDRARLRGCIPHRLGSLSEHGLIGVTAVGRNRRQALQLLRALLRLG